jgi:hypothetical protein
MPNQYIDSDSQCLSFKELTIKEGYWFFKNLLLQKSYTSILFACHLLFTYRPLHHFTLT